MLTASGRRVRPPRAPLVNAEALASTTLDTKLLENFEGKGQQRMWLVKVPKFLAQHWMEKGKNGPVELGTISVDKLESAVSRLRSSIKKLTRTTRRRNLESEKHQVPHRRSKMARQQTEA